MGMLARDYAMTPTQIELGIQTQIELQQSTECIQPACGQHAAIVLYGIPHTVVRGQKLYGKHYRARVSVFMCVVRKT